MVLKRTGELLVAAGEVAIIFACTGLAINVYKLYEQASTVFEASVYVFMIVFLVLIAREFAEHLVT